MSIDRDTPKVTLTDPEVLAPSGGETCLVSIYGPNLGRRWSLDRDEMIVGRESDCDVMVPIDTVSRRHCKLHRRGGIVSVVDQRHRAQRRRAPSPGGVRAALR